MTSGYSGTPLSKKLGIKEGHRVVTMVAPGNLGDLLEPLPSGVRTQSGPRGSAQFDVLLVFVRTHRELTERFTRAQRRMQTDGGLWVCWPKRTSPLASELRESDVRAHGFAEGLVDNKVCAVDGDWSGLRFVVRLRDR